MKKKVIILVILIILLILSVAFLYPKNVIKETEKQDCYETCSCFGWDYVSYSLKTIKCMGIPHNCTEVCIKEAAPIDINLP